MVNTPQDNTVILVKENKNELIKRRDFIETKKISNTICLISCFDIILNLSYLLFNKYRLISLLLFTNVFGIIGVRKINHNISGIYLFLILFDMMYRIYFKINDSININKQQIRDINIIVEYILSFILTLLILMIKCVLLKYILKFCNKLKKYSDTDKKEISLMYINNGEKYIFL